MKLFKEMQNASGWCLPDLYKDQGNGDLHDSFSWMKLLKDMNRGLFGLLLPDFEN